MSDLLLFWRTIKHLKRKQISNRLSRTIKKYLTVSASYALQDSAPGIRLDPFPIAKTSFSNNSFQFLNREKSFTNGIGWNFDEYGKLWCYHLNYLECLLQEDIDLPVAKDLLNDYIKHDDQLKDGNEPYPTSLRLIHVIKFISLHKIKDIEIDSWIGKHAILLQSNLEFHLMGNHLLENGFALLFASFHLRDVAIYKAASSLLMKELDEQILDDGAHFELSPMYHLILFSRLIDAVNLVTSNDSFNDSLLNTLKDKAVMMLTWLENMMVKGMLPNVNDSFDINPHDIQTTIDYANNFGIYRQQMPLGESGYRIFRQSDYTLLFDIGQIGPDYIPGHAHADSLQFLLWIKGKEIITDTGVSTYERNDTRQTERSTCSHNTVEVDEQNSSEVWASFRVGNRASVFDVKESKHMIEASHDGYKQLGVIHRRKLNYKNQEIKILDTLENNNNYELKSYLHFHPTQNPELKNNKLWLEDCMISFENECTVELSTYQYAQSYNQTVSAIKAIISFTKKLNTIIKILES